jgi:DNA-binding NtrC family response regulator
MSARAMPWLKEDGPGSLFGPVAAARTVVLVSADAELRGRLAERLTAHRWRVREAATGAQAMLHLEEEPAEAMVADGWLPDLVASEFTAHVRRLYPAMDLLGLDGAAEDGGGPGTGARSPRRQELLQAMRETMHAGSVGESVATKDGEVLPLGEPARSPGNHVGPAATLAPRRARAKTPELAPEGKDAAQELVGSGAAMQELRRLLRLVAPRTSTVLIEGETGTGKEVVARALHRMSARADRPFVVLNCAAIPEALLEAELFGHTRGAFTGAVQARTGRIEAAHGGTLLLDEIGEMPLGMQAKMLRFLECGELQRVGDNEMTRVDVRLIAATHQPLERRAAEGTFRLDLYHRLAVFPVEVPPLRERLEDIEELAEHLLVRLAAGGLRKRLRPEAVARLKEHRWPGNVRELLHVLERASILAGDGPEIGVEDVRFGRASAA